MGAPKIPKPTFEKRNAPKKLEVPSVHRPL